MIQMPLKSFVLILAIGIFLFGGCTSQLRTKVQFNVIEMVAPSLNTNIDQNDTSSYEDFIVNNEQYRKPISKGEFLKQVKAAKDYLIVHPSGKVADNLKQQIISDLNIEFLLNKLDQRELVVKIVKTQQYEDFTEKTLLLEDPHVGAFFVLMLIPNKKVSAYPAIIGLHGHGDSNQIFKDNYFGKELAREGFVVIMPSFRAIRCDKTEIAISEKLYLNGFSLLGLRIYETLLMIKYLKHLDIVDKIGIMGHSVGGSIAYYTSIIDHNLKALAFEGIPDNVLLDSCEEDNEFHCETVPELAYYNHQINNFKNLNIPLLIIKNAYGGSNNLLTVIEFFKNNL